MNSLPMFTIITICPPVGAGSDEVPVKPSEIGWTEYFLQIHTSLWAEVHSWIMPNPSQLEVISIVQIQWLLRKHVPDLTISVCQIN